MYYVTPLQSCSLHQTHWDNYSNGIEAGIIFLWISIVLKSRRENSKLLLSCRLYKKQVKRKEPRSLKINSRSFLSPASSPLCNESFRSLRLVTIFLYIDSNIFTSYYIYIYIYYTHVTCYKTLKLSLHCTNCYWTKQFITVFLSYVHGCM
jgi:hypothetical protein